MASKSLDQMRKDALDIFLAGVRAVEPAAAVKRYCQREGNELRIHEKVYDLTQFRNIYIIGAGKAGGPMARAMEESPWRGPWKKFWGRESPRVLFA